MSQRSNLFDFFRQRSYRRVLRALARAVGIVLLTFGLLRIAVVFYATRPGGFEMIINPFVWTSPERVTRRGIRLIIDCALIFIGANLAVRRKPTILFLRHFGLDLNLVVSRVIRAGLGRRYRVVTLDDGVFPSVETPPFELWVSRLAPVTVAFALVVWALILIRGFQRSADLGANLSIETGIMVRFWFTFAAIVLAVALAHLWRLRRQARRIISISRDIPNTLSSLASMRSFPRKVTLFAPQAVVIHVVDSLWREVVANVAPATDVALVDVSVPSESLKWEIEQLRGAALPCIFIAEQSLLQRWWNVDMVTPTSEAAFKSLIGDDSVLLYDAADSLGGPTFRGFLAKSLHAETCDGDRPIRKAAALYRGKHFLQEFVFYGAVIGGAVYIGPSIGGLLAYIAMVRSIVLWSLDLWLMLALAVAFLVVNGVLWLAGLPIRRRLLRPVQPGIKTSARRRAIPWLFIGVLTIALPEKPPRQVRGRIRRWP